MELHTFKTKGIDSIVEALSAQRYTQSFAVVFHADGIRPPSTTDYHEGKAYVVVCKEKNITPYSIADINDNGSLGLVFAACKGEEALCSQSESWPDSFDSVLRGGRINEVHCCYGHAHDIYCFQKISLPKLLTTGYTPTQGVLRYNRDRIKLCGNEINDDTELRFSQVGDAMVLELRIGEFSGDIGESVKEWFQELRGKYESTDARAAMQDGCGLLSRPQNGNPHE